MPASRSVSAIAAGAGRRFGAPRATRIAAPPTKPTDTASRSGITPAVPAIATTTTRATIATSLARLHDRASQGLPTIVAPAAPATYASEGKRVEVTHVDVDTALSSRPGRSRYRSTRTKMMTPAAAPTMTSPIRRHRRCHTSNATITTGTRSALDLSEGEGELSDCVGDL